jgi:hypothetical protein
VLSVRFVAVNGEGAESPAADPSPNESATAGDTIRYSIEHPGVLHGVGIHGTHPELLEEYLCNDFCLLRGCTGLRRVSRTISSGRAPEAPGVTNPRRLRSTIPSIGRVAEPSARLMIAVQMRYSVRRPSARVRRRGGAIETLVLG